MDSDREMSPEAARGRARAGGRAGSLLALPALLVVLMPAAALAQEAPETQDEVQDEARETEAQGEARETEVQDEARETAEPAGDLRTTQMCIDQTIADRLAVKRRRREAVDRLFVKQARHELSALGGYYYSDLFSGTYVAGGAYTYHMTEHTAVEFGAAYTHANADVIRAIEDGRGALLDDDFARVLLVESLLVWSPIYGKLRLGGSIARFDLNASAGVGVVDSATSRGATGVAGVGMKLFVGKALAFRLDVRNHVFRQELLDEGFLVNDISLTSGVSLFLPFTN